MARQVISNLNAEDTRNETQISFGFSSSIGPIRGVLIDPQFVVVDNINAYLRVLRLRVSGTSYFWTANNDGAGEFGGGVGPELTQLLEMSPIAIELQASNGSVALHGPADWDSDVQEPYTGILSVSDSEALATWLSTLPSDAAITLVLDDSGPSAPAFADNTGDAQSWTTGVEIPELIAPEADGAPAPVYSAIDLPSGISFDPATRAISGTPEESASGTIIIRATNSAGIADWTVEYIISDIPPLHQTVDVPATLVIDTFATAQLTQDYPLRISVDILASLEISTSAIATLGPISPLRGVANLSATLTIQTAATASLLRPPQRAGITQQFQLQTIFDAGRFRWADFFDPRAQVSDASAFVERLFPRSKITEILPDPFRTVIAGKSASIICHNTLDADDAWDERTIAEIEALHSAKVTFNEIVRLNRERQRRISVTLRNLGTDEDLMSVRGFLSRIRRSVSQGQFDVQSIDRDKLKTKIPQKVIKDVFEDAVAYDSAAATESVRVVFGQAVRLRLLQLTMDQSTYGPISLAGGSIFDITIQSVYRDGMVVPDTQYEVIEIEGSDEQETPTYSNLQHCNGINHREFYPRD